MKKALLLLTIFPIYFIAIAQTPQLVKNINTQDQGTGLSSDNAVMGNTFYFGSGKTLWKTDGTPSGTIAVRDFTVENAVGLSRFIATSNAVYFMLAVEGGYQLWKTNGTGAGTMMLKDFATNQPLFVRAAVGNTIFFNLPQSATGYELWKTDGTEAGTQMVKDIYPGTANSNPTSFQNINGVLFFCATTSAGTGLWQSDGTEAGTVLIKDLDAADNAYSLTGDMVAVGSKAYFTAVLPSTGRELWVSDGTAAGTFIVKEIYTGSTGSFPSNLTAFNNKLYFVAQDAINRQVWMTDGTEAGTVPLFDALPNSRNDSYNYFVNCNGTLYFSATVGIAFSSEPYVSDGTPSGTRLLKDITPGSNGCDARGYKYFNGLTYFIANTVATGYELWSTDGSEAGTIMLPEIYAGANNGIGGSYLIEAVLSNRFIFSGNDPVHREEPYSSDGTAAGTQLLKNVQTTGLGSYPSYLTVIGNRLYFGALSSGFSDNEPWYSDGTEAGTVLLKDLEPGAAWSRPFEFTDIDNTSFYFRTFNSSSSRDIWKSDGTDAGTTKIVTAISSDKIYISNGLLYFSKADANGNELWKYDGSTASLVKNINPGGLHSFPSNFISFNNQLYFFAEEGTNGKELWKSDGTDAGTQLVADINPGVAGSGTYSDMVSFNNNLYFLGIKNGGLSLIKSDGTGAGTTEVKAFTTNDDAGKIFVFDNAVYFIKKNVSGSQVNEELWKTDGTEAGTVLLKEILPYTTTDEEYVQNNSFYIHNGAFYFYVDQENQFGETEKLLLWKSDGTAAGTVAIKTYQAPPGEEETMEDYFNYIAAYDNNQVLFVFDDAVSGREIWKTDGTVAGTSLVSDLNPGTAGSNPSGLVNFNNAVYFSASDGTDFNEFWKINMGSVVPLKLLSFTAYKQNKTAQLQWHTENEINTSHFEIERSSNGRGFTNIGKVAASGRSAGNYLGFDDLPFNGINYYRLKMIDKDGTFAYSQTIKIDFAQGNNVTVLPNPANNFIILANASQYNALRLVDMNGKEVRRFEKNAHNKYDIKGVAKGLYLLQLFSGEVVDVKKIMIE